MKLSRAARGLAGAATLALLLIVAGRARAGVSVEDLCRAVVEDPSYKVRVSAALTLGRVGGPAAVPALIKALSDQNNSVRGIAAQSLGKIGDPAASEPLRDLARRDSDAFVKSQATAALALLSGGGGPGKRAKIYLVFGPFTGGVKSAGPEASRVIADALTKELGKLSSVTLSLSASDQHNFAKSGMLGFFIDGNITKLEDVGGGAASETNCDVKVMVARWPTKSIISWTNAGASVQSGSRPRDKESARHDCLEASAGQLADDLGHFFKSQGG
ncbi:MAG TPA: HEAT repeat domain-containing protein [Polyangia bacterium]|nr:HEAT repeat domain-containing protein [Polyangia bacterium]